MASRLNSKQAHLNYVQKEIFIPQNEVQMCPCGREYSLFLTLSPRQPQISAEDANEVEVAIMKPTWEREAGYIIKLMNPDEVRGPFGLSIRSFIFAQQGYLGVVDTEDK